MKGNIATKLLSILLKCIVKEHEFVGKFTALA